MYHYWCSSLYYSCLFSFCGGCCGNSVVVEKVLSVLCLVLCAFLGWRLCVSCFESGSWYYIAAFGLLSSSLELGWQCSWRVVHFPSWSASYALCHMWVVLFIFLLFWSFLVSSFGFLSSSLFRRRFCSFSWGGCVCVCLISDIGLFGVSIVRFLLLFFLDRDVLISLLRLLAFYGRYLSPHSPLRRASMGFVGWRRARPSLRIGFALSIIIDNKYGTSGKLLLALIGVTCPRHSVLVITPPGPSCCDWPSFPAFSPPWGGALSWFFPGMAYFSSESILVRAMHYFALSVSGGLLCIFSPFSPVYPQVSPAHSQGAQKGYLGYGGMRWAGLVNAAGVFCSWWPHTGVTGGGRI